MLSKKTLEQNYFSEGQFQSIVSSFEPKKSFRITQDTFGSPQHYGTTQSGLNLTTSGKFSVPRLITLG